jgi:hypothetical protein
MSAAAVLPYIWAFAQGPSLVKPPAPPPEPNLAFYRKYTHALLRRYVRMSLEAGRVPSMLGQEMFRAKVTSYRVESFEDVVIFLHDVEHCLEQLGPQQQNLICHIALEEYTVLETAAMLRLDPQTIARRYAHSLDCLTAIFLSVRILEPAKSCQGAKTADIPANT